MRKNNEINNLKKLLSERDSAPNESRALRRINTQSSHHSEKQESRRKPKSRHSRVNLAPEDDQSTDSFFRKWGKNEKNDNVRSDLLDKVINLAPLKTGVLKRKQEFLMCLQAAIDSSTPILYEKAIVILSELIDMDYLTKF